MGVQVRQWPFVGLILAVGLSVAFYFNRTWLFANDDWVFWVHIPALMIHQVRGIRLSRRFQDLVEPASLGVRTR